MHGDIVEKSAVNAQVVPKQAGQPSCAHTKIEEVVKVVVLEAVTEQPVTVEQEITEEVMVVLSLTPMFNVVVQSVAVAVAHDDGGSDEYVGFPS